MAPFDIIWAKPLSKSTSAFREASTGRCSLGTRQRRKALPGLAWVSKMTLPHLSSMLTDTGRSYSICGLLPRLASQWRVSYSSIDMLTTRWAVFSSSSSLAYHASSPRKVISRSSSHSLREMESARKQQRPKDTAGGTLVIAVFHWVSS